MKDSFVEVPFGVRRSFEYFKTNFFIMWKSTIEFKANFISSLLFTILFTGIQFFSTFIYASFLGDDFGWTLMDFFLLYIFSKVILFSIGILCFGKSMFFILTSGSFNSLLTRPLHPFVSYIFSSLNGHVLVGVLFRLVLLFFVLWYFSVEFYNVFLTLFVMFLISLFYFLFLETLGSLEFYMKGASRYLGGILWWGDSTFTQNPAQLFKKIPSKILVLVFPAFFVSSLLIPVFRGYEVWEFWFQIWFLVGACVFLGLFIFWNWRYGLKKYEAFG